MTAACDKGDEVACDNLSREEDAKRAWLAKQDFPTWGKAATAFANAASEAAQMAEMTVACDEGDEVACDNLSREEDAKRAWLAKLDVPTWGNTAKMSEEQAKKAWLAKQDFPTWGQAATAFANAASEAAQMADMTAACDEGDEVACDDLSREEEAKCAWLAKQDVPTWGKAATAFASASSEAAQMAEMTAACDAGVQLACEDLSREEEAKRAWLAKQELPTWGPKAAVPPEVPTEGEATKVLLESLNAPTWDKAAKKAQKAWRATETVRTATAGWAFELPKKTPPRARAGGASMILLDTLARRGTEDETVVNNEFYSPDINETRIAGYRERVERINALEDELEELDDEQLAAKTVEFRERLAAGASEDDLLEEAFAVVREGAWRALELRHYDVQLMGAMALNDGTLAQMGTGEGKTLTCTAAVYLNALRGEGAMLVTVNDYLARRDAEQMGQVYSFLGLTVGLVQGGMPNNKRRAAYVTSQ